MSYPIRISASRLRLFRSCRYAHLVRFVRRIRRKVESDEAVWGNAWHELVAEWWDPLRYKLTKDSPHKPIAASRGLSPSLRAMFDLYRDRWENHNYEVVAVEHPFEMHVFHPDTHVKRMDALYVGTIDLILRDPEGLHWVVEHKSTGGDISPDSMYWHRVRMDDQVCGYVLALEALGMPCGGVIYDAVKRPQHVQKRAVAPDKVKLRKDGQPRKGQQLEDESEREFVARMRKEILKDTTKYFGTRVFSAGDLMLERFCRDLWVTCDDIIRDVKAGVGPRSSHACFHGSNVCDYWQHCYLGRHLVVDDQWESS